MTDETFTPKHLKHLGEYGITGHERALAAFALKQWRELDEYKDVRQELLHRAEKAEQERNTLQTVGELKDIRLRLLESQKPQLTAARKEIEMLRGIFVGNGCPCVCDYCMGARARIDDYDRVKKEQGK